MARKAGSKSSVTITLERLNELFGENKRTKVQVGKGWLKSAAEFLAVVIPEASEDEDGAGGTSEASNSDRPAATIE